MQIHRTAFGMFLDGCFHWAEPETDARKLDAELDAWCRSPRLDCDGADRDDLSRLAESRYARAVETFDRLDGKANALFTIGAALSGGFLAASGTLNLNQGWFILAIGLWLAATILALRASMPITIREVLDVREACEFVKDWRQHALDSGDPAPPFAEALVVAFKAAADGTAHASGWKADKLFSASALICAGIVCAMLAVFLGG